MLTHTLKKDEKKDFYTLVRNGEPCACPFQIPNFAQDSLQRPVRLGQTCNSTCPKFDIQNTSTDMKVSLTCGGAEVTYSIQL